MPKTPKPTDPIPTARRSSRLQKTRGLNTVAIPVVDAGEPSSSRQKRRKTTIREAVPICTHDDSASVAKPHASPDLRRSHRITPAELIRRERLLLKEEQECKQRALDLDQRALLLLKKEGDATLMLSQIAEREAKASLAQLEEHFTCPL
ncbi:hypothetical protein H0H81_007210 [Sphagnurus paluster]|uniref:Uncharacterized protein n=1 Tax=Sphagnurus paluster TaxID=117069 RepID=A0A9P7FSW3_9AGAR|nr:hypothetical protein H0H81_007210 [Sphagnurus paluster]